MQMNTHEKYNLAMSKGQEWDEIKERAKSNKLDSA